MHILFFASEVIHHPPTKRVENLPIPIMAEDISGGKYITKYVIDLSIAPLITEIHVYADKKVCFNIPVEYCSDATTVTVNGKQNYIRNFSIEKTVIYHAMKNKTIAALEKQDFLEKYTGILVHDHETALYHFGTDHAECNIHIIRYLRKNKEDTEHKWSGKMIALLCEMNKARKELINQGILSFSKKTIADYEQKYHELIADGRKENKKAVHKYAKKDELNVFFDDNISERDLRKVKNRQKMAGGFRKDSEHEMYCSILTIIETIKRRKMGMIENIRKLFMGTPAIF